MPKLYFSPGSTLKNLSPIQKLELNYTCQCIKNKVNNIKTSYKDPSQTKSQRISTLVAFNGLGGRIQFGNGLYPIQTNIFGKYEGQSGGSGTAIKNKF
jgi:hypothetical protein